MQYAMENSLASALAHLKDRGSGTGLVRVTLREAPSVTRARGAQKYLLLIQHDELGSGNPLCVINARGSLRSYSFAQATRWILRMFPGGRYALLLHVPQAEHLPPPWTAQRVAAVDAKAARVNAVALDEQASAKLDSTAAWADSARKREVVASARRMQAAAAFARGETEPYDEEGGGYAEGEGEEGGGSNY